jgi:hypothetical protein
MAGDSKIWDPWMEQLSEKEESEQLGHWLLFIEVATLVSDRQMRASKVHGGEEKWTVALCTGVKEI